MPLPSKTLDAIQGVGAAAFKADTQLKQAVKDYATQVHSAMLTNPFDAGNDNLFEEWKSVCRLSQAVEQIELELKKIYDAASSLRGVVSAPNKTLALPSPVKVAPSTPDVVKADVATDVKVKKPSKMKRTLAPKEKSAGPLPSNAASLLAHLSTVLNANTFEKVNQSSVATAINMAKGSVGASVRRLVQEGFLEQDVKLGLKLTAPKA
jgi:hypothetical protein